MSFTIKRDTCWMTETITPVPSSAVHREDEEDRYNISEDEAIGGIIYKSPTFQKRLRYFKGSSNGDLLTVDDTPLPHISQPNPATSTTPQRTKRPKPPKRYSQLGPQQTSTAMDGASMGWTTSGSPTNTHDHDGHNLSVHEKSRGNEDTTSSHIFTADSILLFVFLLLTVTIALIVFRIGPDPAPEVSQVVTPKINHPICRSPDHFGVPCISRIVIVRNSVVLHHALLRELAKRSERKGCLGAEEDRFTLRQAKAKVYRLANLSRHAVDDAFPSMITLAMQYPSFGLKIEVTDPSEEGLRPSGGIIYATYASPSLFCRFIGSLTFLSVTVSSLTAGKLDEKLKFDHCLCPVVLLGFLVWRWRKQMALEEDEMYKIMGLVIQLLENHESLQDHYVSIINVRDEIMDPKDRKEKWKLWERVVREIATNESRIKVQNIIIEGTEYPAWRWVPLLGTPGPKT